LQNLAGLPGIGGTDAMLLKHDSFVRFNQVNPKRSNSSAARRYEDYKSARTVREALALGALSADLQHDFKKGFMVTLPDERCQSDEPHLSEMQNLPPHTPEWQPCRRSIAHVSRVSVRRRSISKVHEVGDQQGAKRAFSELSPTSPRACSQSLAPRTPHGRRFWKLRRRSRAPPPVDLEAATMEERCSRPQYEVYRTCQHFQPDRCKWGENCRKRKCRKTHDAASGAEKENSPSLSSTPPPTLPSSQAELAALANQAELAAWENHKKQRDAMHSTPEFKFSSAQPSRAGHNRSPCSVLSSASPPPRGLHARSHVEAQFVDGSPDVAVAKQIAIPHMLQAHPILSVSFRASELAALIGLHCHGAAIHALVRCWARHHKASFRSWTRLTGGISLPEVVFARHASVRVHAAVRAASREGDGALPENAAARIKAAVQISAPPALWQALTDEAMGRARCARGTRLEVTGLNAYEKKFGRHVVRRNMDALRRLFPAGSTDRASVFAIAGRVDGFEEVSGERWVVEHKRRQRRLFKQVPRYEEVQCQAYMAMTGSPACRWVQTLGPEVDVRSLAHCPRRWACVEGRLANVARLLRRLCSGNLCPPSGELEYMHRAACESVAPWPDGHAPVPAEGQVDGDSVMPVESSPVVASGMPDQAIIVENSVPLQTNSPDRALTKVHATHASALPQTPVRDDALGAQNCTADLIERASMKTRATHAVCVNEAGIDSSNSTLSMADQRDRAVVKTQVTHVSTVSEVHGDEVTLDARIANLATVTTVMETQIQETIKVASPGTQVDSHQATLYDNDASTTEDEMERSIADSTELDESEAETLQSSATLLESAEGTR